MAERHKYSVDDLKNAVKDSRSIAQVLIKLGIVPAGGNYQTVKRRIAKYCIDTSHFGGQSWNKGKTLGPKRSLDFYLKNNSCCSKFQIKEATVE